MSHGAQDPELLRCTAFEELMLDQDGPRHPCVISLRLELDGALEVSRLEQALGTTIERHPLLRANLECRWGKLWWRVHPNDGVDLRVHHTAAPAWPIKRHFDLVHSFGLQADLFPTFGNDSWILFLQIHHAVADGLGCLQIVQDLLSEYAEPGQRTEQRNIQVLKDRNRFGLNINNFIKLLSKQVVGLAGVRQFLMRRPVPMACHLNVSIACESITAIHLRLTAEQTEYLKQSCKQRHATLNDYLACLIFEACDQFRRSHAGYSDTDWLRMMVPMSLRTADSPCLSACNAVSCVFLDRTGQQISRRSELLQSIHDEMQLIKRNRLGLIFVYSLWLKKVLRFRSRHHALVAPKPSRCQTSVVFSNMGRVFEPSTLPTSIDGQVQSGQIKLVSLEVLAPVAPLMYVAITTLQYAGRLTLSMRYDVSEISDDNANHLLKLIADRVHFSTPETSHT